MRKGDVLELLKKFRFEVLDKKPPLEKMVEEAKSMGFKLKPIGGDLLEFAVKKNNNLVELIWLIGKLDEFLNTKLKNFSKKEIDLFLDFFSKIYIDEVIKKADHNLKDLDLELEIIKKIPFEKKTKLDYG